MPLGKITQRMDYDKPPAEALADVSKAMEIIGELRSTEEGVIKGMVKYGAQQVQLKVRILPAGEKSTLEMTESSDDIWAYGAKKGLERLKEALDNRDNPDYVPDPKTMLQSKAQPSTIIGGLSLLLLCFGIYGYSRGHNEPWGALQIFDTACLGLGVVGLIAGFFLMWRAGRK